MLLKQQQVLDQHQDILIYHGLKSTPSFNPAPDSLETTTLNETTWKTYIPGLKDLGGPQEFTFNLSQVLMDVWSTLVDSSVAAKATGKSTWFVIVVPGLTEAFYLRGDPADAGLPETTANSVLETTMYITPTGAPVWAAKPTDFSA